MRCALLFYCLGLLAFGVVGDIAIGLKALALFFLLGLLAALVAARGRPHGSRFYWPVLSGFCFVIGMLWHGLWAHAILQQRLPLALEGIDMVSYGVVVSMPQRNLLNQQFEFQINTSDVDFANRKVLLNYYGEHTIEPGQRWRFVLRLNRPHGFANPGGFDYEAWLFQRGITAKGYVRSSVENELLEARGCSLLCGNLLFSPGSIKVLISSLRYNLRSRLLALMEGSDYGGIVLALVLGDRSAMASADWQLLTDTGSNHLFVISGLHIGMIAGFCFYLSMYLLRFFPVVGLTIPLQKLAAMVAILAAVSYALLAGFSMPTQRALVMIVVFMLGHLANRRYLVSFRFLLALAIVLSLNPLAAWNAGFWFSFIAVGALLMCMDATVPEVGEDIQGGFFKSKMLAAKAFSYSIKPQLLVFFALLVPLVFWTQQLSLLAPLVNCVAIPLVGFGVVPLCLLSLLLLSFSDAASHACLSVVEIILRALFTALQWLLHHTDSWAVIQFSGIHLWQVLPAALAVVILLLPRGVVNRGLIIPLSLPLLLPVQASRIGEGVIKIHVLDVGQGLAIIVQTANHSLVYDTGANLSADFNIGAAVLVPVLRTLAIRQVDRVVISHGDNDHAGGLSGLMAAMPVDVIYSSTQQLNTQQRIFPCQEAQNWRWDGVEFQFLSIAAAPALQAGFNSTNGYSMNNNSCVLQIKTGDNSALLPGDIEVEAERKLALNYGENLQSTIIVAPHHGSKTSSSFSLLKNVNPEHVVFSSGYQNSFNHPSEEIVTRYAQFAASAVSTASSGMISFTLEPDKAIEIPVRYRTENSHYWY